MPDSVQLQAEEFALIKFWHVVDGIYIWEFLITLDLDWDVMRGHRTYQRTYWVYVLARVAALVAVIINIIVLNIEVLISCQSTILFRLIPVFLAFSTTSLLLALRTISVWNKRLSVAVISIFLWLINFAFIVQHLFRIREGRVAGQDVGNQCTALNVQATVMANFATLVTDFLLFIIMVVGLLRHQYHREDSSRMRHLAHFFWNQGVVWVFIVIVFGIVPAVLSCLNISALLYPKYQIRSTWYALDFFKYPWIIAMTIATTRMYRTLQDLSSPAVGRHTYESPQTGGVKISIKGTRAAAGPIPLSKISVDVRSNPDNGRAANTSNGVAGTSGT